VSVAEKFGPWLGVSRERQTLCAVEGCADKGKSHVCPYDGAAHHHGCVHYECDAGRSGLQFRKGWGLVCDKHYAMLREAVDRPRSSAAEAT
jgi:hypothetical protein